MWCARIANRNALFDRLVGSAMPVTTAAGMKLLPAAEDTTGAVPPPVGDLMG